MVKMCVCVNNDIEDFGVIRDSKPSAKIRVSLVRDSGGPGGNAMTEWRRKKKANEAAEKAHSADAPQRCALG